MISDVTFAVFHYPMAGLLKASRGYVWPTHIHQSTCGYNFPTHGATFCPTSDCHSGSLAFILIHNFSPLPRWHGGSYRVPCPPTCYTPRPISLSDKSGDDRVRIIPLWYLSLLLAQGKIIYSPLRAHHPAVRNRCTRCKSNAFSSRQFRERLSSVFGFFPKLVEFTS